MGSNKKRFLAPAFFVLIIVFFAVYLRGIDFSQIQAVSIDWPLLGFATLVSLSFRYWGVFIWRTILKDLGAKELPKFDILSAVYAKAWMGRYIPGTVTWIAGKVFLAGRAGISKSRLAVASIVEAGVQIVAVAVVSLFLVGFDPRTEVIPAGLKILLVAGAAALLVMLNPVVFNRALGFAYKKIKGKEPYGELRTNGKTVGRSFLLYAIGSFISGGAYFFMTKSIQPAVDWKLFFYLVGAFNLAGVIGMATPFVPSGLGVRDGAQLVLLSVVFPKEIALILTVFSRLWSALVDVLFYFSAQAYRKIKNSEL